MFGYSLNIHYVFIHDYYYSRGINFTFKTPNSDGYCLFIGFTSIFNNGETTLLRKFNIHTYEMQLGG